MDSVFKKRVNLNTDRESYVKKIQGVQSQMIQL